jgi:hypothetical protein
MSELTMVRGDSFSFDGAPAERNGVPINLTGAQLKFTLRRTNDPIDLRPAVVQKDTVGGGVAVVSAPAGTYRVTLLPADTQGLTYSVTLYYDVELTESGGTVTTVDSGTLYVDASRDITRP